MGTNFFTGSAQPISQVDTFVVGGTAAAGQTYTVTMNGKTVTYIALSTDANTDICAGLLALLLDAAVAPAEFQEETWTSDGNLTITGTMTNQGVPSAGAFTSTASGTGTLVHTAVTAASGPSWWSNTGNWSLGAVPITGDDVYLESSSISLSFGLAQSAVTLNSLNIAASYTGQLGNKRFNVNGYLETRGTYLAIGAATINIGYGEGSGSSLIKINNGTVQTTMTIEATGQPAEDGMGAVQWKGTHVSNAITITLGNLSVALYGGEVATLATLNVGHLTNVQTDSFVQIGAGVTLGTLDQFGGTVNLAAGATTVECQAGLLSVTGSAAFTTFNATGGDVTYMSTGTVGTLLLSNGGTIDYSQDPRPKIVTNQVLIYSGCTFNDPNSTVTLSASFKTVGCTLADIKMDNGRDKVYAVT